MVTCRFRISGLLTTDASRDRTYCGIQSGDIKAFPNQFFIDADGDTTKLFNSIVFIDNLNPERKQNTNVMKIFLGA